MIEHVILHLVLHGLKNKAERSGAVLKEVKCEQCSTEYVYLLQRTARVAEHCSRQALERKAERALQFQLATGFDLVPCPVCGWYQSAMVRREKRRAGEGLWIGGVVAAALSPVPLGVALLLLAIALFPNGTPAPPPEAIAVPFTLGGLCLVTSLGLWIAARIRSARYNLNAADQDERIQLGRSLARPKKEIAHLLE
jgi:hypothetical protein